MQSTHSPRRIAVVGSGIAGLAAAWAMARRPGFEVILLEADDHFGGHANTVDIELDGRRIAVDTGFIVYNDRNYPHLRRLFRQLGVVTDASDMSFGVSLDGGNTEYSGTDLNGLFAQRRNTLRPRFWRMLGDVARFYRRAPGYLDTAEPGMSIGDLLARESYSTAFVEDHLVPMAAAIWSASADDIRRYPADAFIRFFDNHGLLSLTRRPQWRTVAGGSREYVARLLADAPIDARLGVGATRVARRADGVQVETTDGGRLQVDDVVLATHADRSLALLDDADADERSVLSAFRYSSNEAWLHDDPALMPRRRAAWSSWNYLAHASDAHTKPVSVTYWMNRLQALATDLPVFVTLNPGREPAAASVYRRIFYEHPVFTADTAAAQLRSATIQGRRRTWFCGAYLGHGFHEDGVQSGLWTAAQLGAPAPWRGEVAFNRLPANYRDGVARAA